MLSFGYKYKNCKYKKSVNSPQKSGSIYKKNVKMLKYPRGGRGGPPSFVAC
jgi:hypothetical protein